LSTTGLTITEGVKNGLVSSYENPPKSILLDNQLEFFTGKLRKGGDFTKNHIDNVLNMKIIEHCYSKTLSKDNAIFVNLLRHNQLNKGGGEYGE
jgi:hypothetical protein